MGSYTEMRKAEPLRKTDVAVNEVNYDKEQGYVCCGKIELQSPVMMNDEGQAMAWGEISSGRNSCPDKKENGAEMMVQLDPKKTKVDSGELECGTDGAIKYRTRAMRHVCYDWLLSYMNASGIADVVKINKKKVKKEGIFEMQEEIMWGKPVRMTIPYKKITSNGHIVTPYGHFDPRQRPRKESIHKRLQ